MDPDVPGLVASMFLALYDCFVSGLPSEERGLRYDDPPQSVSARVGFPVVRLEVAQCACEDFAPPKFSPGRLVSFLLP